MRTYLHITYAPYTGIVKMGKIGLTVPSQIRRRAAESHRILVGILHHCITSSDVLQLIRDEALVHTALTMI